MREESKGKKRQEKPILTKDEEIKMGERLKAEQEGSSNVLPLKAREEKTDEAPKVIPAPVQAKPPPPPEYVPPVIEAADVKAKKAGEFFGDRRIKLALVRFKEPVAGGNFGAEFVFKSDKVNITMVDDDYVEVRALDATGSVVLSPMSNVSCMVLA